MNTILTEKALDIYTHGLAYSQFIKNETIRKENLKALEEYKDAIEKDDEGRMFDAFNKLKALFDISQSYV